MARSAPACATRSAAVLRSRFCAASRSASDASSGSRKQRHHCGSGPASVVRLRTLRGSGPNEFGRDDRRRDEVGADRASRKSERGDGAKDERAHRLPLRDAR